MNNYIVNIERFNEEFKVDIGKEKFKNIQNRIYSSDAIIWNAFAPWKYSHHINDPKLIAKIITKVFNKELSENDFNNNIYSFFGHKPQYFGKRSIKPDLVKEDIALSN